MPRWRKALLVLEVVLCFGTLVFFWGLGLVLVIDQGNSAWRTPELVRSIAAGAVGLVALVVVLVALLRERTELRARWWVLIAIAIGATPILMLVPSLPGEGGWLGFMLVIPPLACSAHVVYLARHLLAPEWFAPPTRDA